MVRGGRWNYEESRARREVYFFSTRNLNKMAEVYVFDLHFPVITYACVESNYQVN